MASVASDETRIGRMDAQTAKRLGAGQVVTSLANVVKELLENAMDAKATYVLIRLKEMGKEEIAVVDNGFGIARKDFDVLGQRHCTSKLTDFADLLSISSFGFRGEALNSLCYMSDVSIQTKHTTDVIGSELKFDAEARLVSREQIALNVGTAVTIRNLFRNTPVRKKDFHNNLKREFDKMVRLVYSYCVGSIGVRICLTNQMTNKAKQTIVSTQAVTLRNNIVDVFDLKQYNCLIHFQNKNQTEEDDTENDILVSGLISKTDSGCGRSATDRQFFYVNERPCDMKALQKFINGIYRSYNRSQYPFILLKIKMDKHCVDFNLSPDKRELLIRNEDKVFKMIKESLESAFNRETSCPVDSMANYLNKDKFSQPKKRQLTETTNNDNDDEVSSLMSSGEPISSPFKQSRRRSPCDSPFKETTIRDVLSSSPITPPLTTLRERSENSFTTARRVFDRFDSDTEDFGERQKRKRKSMPSPEAYDFQSIDKIPVVVSVVKSNSSVGRVLSNSGSEEKRAKEMPTHVEDKTQQKTTECWRATPEDDSNQTQAKAKDSNHSMSAETETGDVGADITFDLDSDQIKELFLQSIENNEPKEEQRFSAQIRPSQNEKAEQELIHELKKTSFEDMKIVGQFNRGFIVTKLGSNLFIVDQHASDERYNYERLMASTAIENQKLVVPMPLELSASNEMIVMDNTDLFKRLGFGIVVNDTATPGHRIHLSSIPISKDWTADKDDVDELVGQLIETPADLLLDYKLNGFKEVIASRACRYSAMIGHPLSKSQMQDIVAHMSVTKNPWQCAHNRPTIRFLVGLNDIDSLSDN